MSTSKPKRRKGLGLAAAALLAVGVGSAQADPRLGPPVFGKVAGTVVPVNHRHVRDPSWALGFDSVVGPFWGVYFGSFHRPLSFDDWCYLEERHRRYTRGFNRLSPRQRARLAHRHYRRYLNDFQRFRAFERRYYGQLRYPHRAYRGQRDLLAEHRARRFNDRFDRRVERRVERQLARERARRAERRADRRERRAIRQEQRIEREVDRRVERRLARNDRAERRDRRLDRRTDRQMDRRTDRRTDRRQDRRRDG
ncbi:MAG: hypothetical protein AAF648_11110 [Pseudomonadota bacterium]